MLQFKVTKTILENIFTANSRHLFMKGKKRAVKVALLCQASVFRPELLIEMLSVRKEDCISFPDAHRIWKSTVHKKKTMPPKWCRESCGIQSRTGARGKVTFLWTWLHPHSGKLEKNEVRCGWMTFGVRDFRGKWWRWPYSLYRCRCCSVFFNYLFQGFEHSF